MSILDTWDLWGIVLAGGSGTRLLEYTHTLYGEDRPKQYCAFIGRRSMIQHTHDRALMLVKPNHLLTVVTLAHLPFAKEQIHPRLMDHIIIQPYCRETASAIMLPLSKIHHHNPGSISVIFPSDHFILDEWKFIHYVKKASAFVKLHPEKIVVLGVEPERQDHSYGWIEKGDQLFERMFEVRQFREKPFLRKGDRFEHGQFFWNTFVIIARTGTIMDKIKETIPQAYDTFEVYRRSIGTRSEQQAINAAFDRLETVNFSIAVLEQITSSLVVMDITGVGWSDWGEEYRIREDTVRYDLRLNVPGQHERMTDGANTRTVGIPSH